MDSKNKIISAFMILLMGINGLLGGSGLIVLCSHCDNASGMNTVSSHPKTEGCCSGKHELEEFDLVHFTAEPTENSSHCNHTSNILPVSSHPKTEGCCSGKHELEEFDLVHFTTETTENNSHCEKHLEIQFKSSDQEALLTSGLERTVSPLIAYLSTQPFEYDSIQTAAPRLQHKGHSQGPSTVNWLTDLCIKRTVLRL